ncbi:BsuPI-related putative proteinase inhibitor [Niallia endozanthoxylica]|uniref:Intracellular proteinase inhibitor BsuPI domain-containing protein n=1 Tax=Niallia endozanthoxylica TaxID=2036016 RepID=A0A5J5I050_9BACI|nr:BsuPI-related putative proteinase inhibitor [Niallia endozanthoxylica]KAA9028548.1 hypothetical protein F4V44_04570 [Niallia endozanthoxylica]
MKKAWILLVLGLFLVGCGAVNNNSDEQNSDGSGIVAGEMAAVLTETSPFVFQYEVKNQTEKEVTLEFSSSQRFDYLVETKTGEQVYLFSSVAMFMAVMGEETMKPGETLSYEVDLHELDLKAGDYLLTAWMTPKDGKAYQVTKAFTVK